MGRYAVALIAAVGAADLPAQTLPAPFQAEYVGSKFPLSAEATIGLARIGDYYRYTLRATVRAAFFKWTDVYDCSVLRIDGDRFYPLEYMHRDTRESRHNAHTHFDWDRRIARTTRGDGKVEEVGELPQVAWDPMSVQVRLRADVAGAERGSELEYVIVEKEKKKHRRVSIGGAQEMHWDERTLQIVKAETVGGKHDDAFWFAKNYAWLPVRLTISGVTLNLASSPDEARREPAAAGDGAPSC